VLRRLITFILLLALAAALLIAAYPQLVGLNQQYFVAQVIAFRGALVVVGFVLAVVFLFIGILARPLRGFFATGAVFLLIFTAFTGAIVFERGTGVTKFHTKDATDVTVLSWNTRGGAPGAAEIARLALANHADVISLPETRASTAGEVAAAMKKTGHPMQVLTLAYNQVDPAASTSLLISPKLGSYTMQKEKKTTEVLPTIIATPAKSTSPVIVAVHAVAPVAKNMSEWRSDLRYLSKVCNGKSMIMAGDFNATLDHLSGLGTRSAALGSCRDTALTSGNAGLGTWPTDVPSLLGAPIDHVLTTLDWKVSGMTVITSEDKAGSDHRPILAQLTPRSQ
jgi:endonuclease/exonuclease/phosphatase (EEP) superfamily protein YafD